MKNYKIMTLGCKVNHFESEAIDQYLKNAEWHDAEPGKKADVVIINTCTVTQKASMQSRQTIRQAIRSNPNARIMVTGCYAQTGTKEIKKIKGIHDIIGSALKHRIPRAILSSPESKRPDSPVILVPDINREQIFKQTPVGISSKRTRPFLKIQDGCNAFCSYCVVPYARGRSRSMAAEDVLEKIKLLSDSGYKETVLTGVHLGCYGKDFSSGNKSLYSLLKRIEESGTINRVRLSSIEPHELTTEIIDLVASSSILCHHFHIPLQSGDDQILEMMNRPYKAERFRELVLQIRKSIPKAAIGVDVLIGFPGETEKAFDSTYELIKDLPVTYLHVFPFSPRKETPAYRYPNQVNNAVVKKRCKKMRELGKLKKKNFLQQSIGKTTEILIEEKPDKKSNLLKGISDNYIIVLLDGPRYLKNTIVKVRIDKVFDDNSVMGILLR
ncbi:MAG: tRNA (N(6)-L-threonylcarbamoyladenosine(37)-C(2))-methylthiotransferase MtaB [Deltaproteobacteria bacterium]|nr:tRNA (N(6)-L-threonylcarbamoyladenosine(37)-C(2))-methylthiotransferase MtaB [Deltaproteobacteria bacterium]